MVFAYKFGFCRPDKLPVVPMGPVIEVRGSILELLEKTMAQHRVDRWNYGKR